MELSRTNQLRAEAHEHIAEHGCGYQRANPCPVRDALYDQLTPGHPGVQHGAPGEEPVIWAGRKFGQLTPDEQRRAIRAAGAALSAELTANAGAISAAMDAAGPGELSARELDLLRTYAKGPRIWDAADIYPRVLALADRGLIEPVGERGAYQLTAKGSGLVRERLTAWDDLPPGTAGRD